MFIEMSKRPYRMARRAESRDETRARIVDAAVALHGELGPRTTSISAIAERAGVQRLTVYRHFPDDESLFAACSAEWTSRHPFPDMASLAGAGRQACREGLLMIYRYYRANRQMLASVARDAPVMPVLAGPRARAAALLEAAVGTLVERLNPPLSRTAFATVTLAHAAHFETWQSLEAAALDDEAKADLVMAWLD
jgi:AcrR family transcriptional regulator